MSKLDFHYALVYWLVTTMLPSTWLLSPSSSPHFLSLPLPFTLFISYFYLPKLWASLISFVHHSRDFMLSASLVNIWTGNFVCRFKILELPLETRLKSWKSIKIKNSTDVKQNICLLPRTTTETLRTFYFEEKKRHIVIVTKLEDLLFFLCFYTDEYFLQFVLTNICFVKSFLWLIYKFLFHSKIYLVLLAEL